MSRYGTHILKDNKEASIEKFLKKHGKSLKKIYEKAKEEALKTDNKVMGKTTTDRKKLPKQQQKNLAFMDSCENNPNFEKIESKDGKFIEYYDKANKTYSGFFDKNTGRSEFNDELDELEARHSEARQKGKDINQRIKDIEKDESENDRRTISHLKNRSYKGR